MHPEEQGILENSLLVNTKLKTLYLIGMFKICIESGHDCCLSGLVMLDLSVVLKLLFSGECIVFVVWYVSCQVIAYVLRTTLYLWILNVSFNMSLNSSVFLRYVHQFHCFRPNYIYGLMYSVWMYLRSNHYCKEMLHELTNQPCRKTWIACIVTPLSHSLMFNCSHSSYCASVYPVILIPSSHFVVALFTLSLIILMHAKFEH